MSISYQGPVVLVVADGIGLSDNQAGNAVSLAYNKTITDLIQNYKSLRLRAAGIKVGLPVDDTGNSEIGHSILGAGQIIKQGANLVDEMIESGKMFEGQVWKDAVSNVKKHSGKAMHFIGILSDGGVHSNISHLLKMLTQAKKDGVKKARIHVLLDGHDVPATSALVYVQQLEDLLRELNADGVDYRIASGGGRMKITADKYGEDWNIVAEGWKTHVLGDARGFGTATEAIETARWDTPGIVDAFLPPFVIKEGDKPVGTIEDGDTVVYFDFKANRAIEFTKAMELADFDKFDRVRVPKVFFAGLMNYSPMEGLPKNYLITPAEVSNTLTEFLSKEGVKQFSVTESVSNRYFTYVFNGNREGAINSKMEEYKDVKSFEPPYEDRPWMKSAEIADEAIAKIKAGKDKFIKVDLPNADIVGFTGELQQTVMAVEAVDVAIQRVLDAVDAAGGVAVVVSSHGKAEETYELDEMGNAIIKGGKPVAKKGRNANPVPFVIYDNTENRIKYDLKISGDFGLANVAATVADLLGKKKPEMWEESLIRVKEDAEY